MFTLIALTRARARLLHSLSQDHSTDNTILHPIRFAKNTVKFMITISLIALLSLMCFIVYLMLDFAEKHKHTNQKQITESTDQLGRSNSAVEDGSPQPGHGEQSVHCNRNYKVHKRKPIKEVQQKNFEKEMEQIANLDVINALEIEIETLRREQLDLLNQVKRTQCSDSKRIQLERKASTIQVRMMKLNEQVMKRRNKL